MRPAKFLICISAFVFFPVVAVAQTPGTATITETTGGVTTTKTISNTMTESSIDYELNYLDSLYDGTATSFNIAEYIYGSQINISSPEGSNDLILNVLNSGFKKTFSGTNRYESADELFKFLENGKYGFVSYTQKYLAQNTPYSTIAGNPSSLQGQMIQQASNISGFSPTERSQGYGGHLSVSVSGGHFNAGPVSGTDITLPISWDYKFGDSTKIILALPITYQSSGNTTTYQTQLDVGLQIPIIGNRLYITPVVSGGGTWSKSFNSWAGMYSFSLGTKYIIPINKSWSFSIQGLGGYISTANLKIGSYNVDPKINNEVSKVGIMTQKVMPFDIWGEPMSARLGYAYTRLYGTHLFMNGYNQVYAGFGTEPGVGAPFYKNIRLGLVGTFGRDYSALSVDFGYSF